MEKEEGLWEEVGGEGTLIGELWIGLPGEGREEEVDEEGEREGEGGVGWWWKGGRWRGEEKEGGSESRRLGSGKDCDEYWVPYSNSSSPSLPSSSSSSTVSGLLDMLGFSARPFTWRASAVLRNLPSWSWAM